MSGYWTIFSGDVGLDQHPSIQRQDFFRPGFHPLPIYTPPPLPSLLPLLFFFNLVLLLYTPPSVDYTF